MIKVTSKKERKLWIVALIVLVAIYATLFLGGQILDLMIRRQIIEQSMFYLFLLLIFAFIVSGWKHSDKRLEHWIYAGVVAVYGMAILRMDITTSERSHMFEYGLLSLLIYEALTERKSNGVYIKTPVLISILGAGTVGLLDECIQYIIPYRVFDIVDIAFNYVASVIGVFISITVSKMKRMLMIW